MIKRRTYYVGFVLWSAIYLIGTIIAPVAPNRFNLTVTQTHLLQMTFAIPIVLVWLAAVYGAERFKSYTQRIKNDPDGKALDGVANGLNILMISVLAGGLGSILRPWALKDGWIRTFTICYGYFQVLLPLLAYWIMFRGSRWLRVITSKKKERRAAWLPILVIIIPIAVIYLFLILHYQYRNDTPNPTNYSSFYLPDYLIILSLALPYLAAWALGIKAAMNLGLYSKKVKGILYRIGFKRITLGIYTIIAFAILLQMLVAFSTTIAQIGLAGILLIIYAIVILYSIGFLLVASGTKKLNEIESINQ